MVVVVVEVRCLQRGPNFPNGGGGGSEETTADSRRGVLARKLLCRPGSAASRSRGALEKPGDKLLWEYLGGDAALFSLCSTHALVADDNCQGR